jgi:hypothetical protein
MRRLSEERALTQLQQIKSSHRRVIRTDYEFRARDCRVCPTPGACCTDAHFVNVQITRLEAVAMRETLARTPRLSPNEVRSVYRRAREAVNVFGLSPARDRLDLTYSCPLYVAGTGCLVHRRAKPGACIQHACYDQWTDLPPLSIQARTEHRVEQLNNLAYGSAWAWLPIPVWLALVDPEDRGRQLGRLLTQWEQRGPGQPLQRPIPGNNRLPLRRSLPVLSRLPAVTALT